MPPPPRKFLEFTGYEVASEPMLLGGQTTEFCMHEHLPFLPVAPLVSAFGSFAKLTSHMLEDSVFRTVRSHLVLCCNMSPHCVRAMGVCRALALFGNAKQATGEGKRGISKTRNGTEQNGTSGTHGT